MLNETLRFQPAFGKAAKCQNAPRRQHANQPVVDHFPDGEDEETDGQQSAEQRRRSPLARGGRPTPVDQAHEDDHAFGFEDEDTQALDHGAYTGEGEEEFAEDEDHELGDGHAGVESQHEDEHDEHDEEGEPKRGVDFKKFGI